MDMHWIPFILFNTQLKESRINQTAVCSCILELCS